MLLTQAIETAVIPHMVMAHRNGQSVTARSRQPMRETWKPDAEQLRSFVWLLVDRDDTLAPSYVESLIQLGVGLDCIHTNLLAEAARQLGALWECDDADFASVTLGLLRLHRLLHVLDSRFTDDGCTQRLRAPLAAKRIVLMPTIGEQHGFGLAMVAQFFRRAAWEVDIEQPASLGDLRALLSSNWFDVIGFSMSLVENLPRLRIAIEVARQSSRNPQIGIMVGGSVFVAQPGLSRELGADATAADAAQAIIEADRLMSSLARTG